MELSIVIPCLNEEKTIGVCVEKALGYIRANDILGEVVVADNGSTDDSVKVAQSFGARVVNVDTRGYGSALQAGIKAATGRYVIMGDGDDSYDFTRLGGFVESLRAGHELVMGNRFKGGIEKGAMPWLHRYLGNPVLSFLGRLFFKSDIGDFHCGLRGFNRERILELHLSAPGMEFASEMVVKASLAGYRIDEVPTTLQQDGRDHPPHLNTWRDGWRHLRFLLIFSPRWMFLYPGLLFASLGFVIGTALVVSPILVNQVIFDIHTLLYMSGLTIIGIQLIFFSVVTQTFRSFHSQFKPSENLERVMAYYTLERGIGVGILVALAGFAWTVSLFIEWQDSDFAALDPRVVMRQAIPAVTLVVIGAQTISTSFLLSAVQSLWPRA